MKRLIEIPVLAAVAVAAAGCIRDEYLPCPPMTVEISVLDKNWSNIDEVQAAGLAVAVDENLPMREYVQSLTYELRDLSTGKLVSVAPSYSISHDGMTEVLTFPESLPFGRYELTLWGNLDVVTKAGSDQEGTASVTLHEDGGDEADQVYHFCGIFDYDYDRADFSAGLQRTVGCLLVDAVNLPAWIDYSEKDIEGVLGTVSKGMEYSDPVSVHTALDWGDNVSSMRTMTCLGPSASEDGTTVQISFRDSDGASGLSGVTRAWPDELVSEPVDITLRRNELTVLKYDYDVDGLHIYVLVDGEWTRVHDMVID